MMDTRSTAARFTGLFLAGGFLFSFPVMTLFNSARLFMGIPLFFVYCFTAWAALICLVMVCAKLPDPFQAGKNRDN